MIDAEYKALRCELWRKQGSDKRTSLYAVVLDKTIIAGCVKVVMFALVKESNEGLMSLIKLVMNCWNDFFAFVGLILLIPINASYLL